jgi:hypothetical protein
MAKVKISEFDVNPDNNTDINNINIAEGCAPSGINNAIRQLMSDLKEFQTGAGGDPFNGAVNGTVGATTPNTGAFTTLSASSTVSGTGFSTYLASPPAIGGTAAAAGAFTSLSASGAFSANGGTTLGDASGDALTINSSAVSIPNGLNFDSNTFVIDATNNRVGVGTASPAQALDVVGSIRASALTSGRVTYAGTSGLLQDDADLTFDGTKLSTSTFAVNSNTASSLVSRLTNVGSAGDFQLYASNGVSTGNSGDVKATIGLHYADTYANLNGGIQFTRGGSGTDGWMNFLTSGSERMRINSSGNVGIGTSSIGSRLDVSSGATTITSRLSNTGTNTYTPTASTSLVNSTFQMVGGGASGATTGIRMSQGGSFELYMGGVQESGGAGAFVFQGYSGSSYAERMRIDSSGNLGLGVTPSAWASAGKALEFAAGSIFSYNSGASGEFDTAYNAFFDGSWKYKASSSAASLYSIQPGVYKWFTAPSGTAGNAITFTQAMTLDASGNLGIGNTSPAARLHVTAPSTAGQAILVNSTNVNGSYQTFQSSGTSYGDIGSLKGISGTGNTTDMALNGRGASGIIAFCINDAEKARIDSSGNLLISRTTPHNFGSGNSQGIDLNASSYIAVSTSGAAAGFFKRYTSTGSIIDFYYSTSAVGSISTNGSNTSYNTSSDYRLKENIAPMTGALAKVSALKPCTYTWKSNGEQGEGFIAHELAQVVPDAVTGEKDAVDVDGKPVYQGIDVSFLVATLTASIQELKAIVDAQAARIAVLESK